jgi:hypothetical protein
MNLEDRLLKEDEAAVAVALDVTIVRMLAECGAIKPQQGYGAAELAELRRVRRLIDDLGLDPEAVEVVLHMRRQMLALQAEVRRLQAELRLARRPARPAAWVESEWTEFR